MVSHEFRTPLGISMSDVGLPRQYAAPLADDQHRERIDDIESSTNQMAKLMEQGSSPAGSPVEFRVHPDGVNAVLTVTDHGIGIPDSDGPRLLEAFHRGDNVGDTPGTGLGPAIVKRCVDLHHDRIEVASVPGAGSTFTVTLPLFAPAPRPAPSPDA